MLAGADRFVLDCSVALAWCFADEATPETEALLDTLKQSEVLVPALWHFEVGNVLVDAERRKRIVAADAISILSLIDSLPIETDNEPPARRRRDVWSLARQHRLTVYDAAYLELALRSGLPLATRDSELMRAGVACGVAVLPNKHKRK